MVDWCLARRSGMKNCEHEKEKMAQLGLQFEYAFSKYTKVIHNL